MKLPTRSSLAAIAALCLVFSASAQTPQGTPFSAGAQINYELGESPQQWHGKLYVGTTNMRFEIENDKPLQQRPVLLTNFVTQTDDVLLPAASAYLEHRVDDPKAVGPARAMRDLRFYDLINPCVAPPYKSCKKIGVEAVSGRSCDHWELERHGTVVNLWLDQKLHFPIKTVTEDATVTLTNLKEGVQDAKLFQIPSGYQRMTATPKGGAAAAQQAPKQ